MVFPQVDVDRIARGSSGSPEIPRRKPDGVDVLRATHPLSRRIGVLQRPHTVILGDDSALAADIARQPRVPLGMNVPRPDLLAGAISRANRQTQSRGTG